MLKIARFFLWGLVAVTLGMGSGAMASQTTQLVPLGRAVGIKLFSDGVVVVGMSPIDTTEGSQQPAKDAGLEVGDIVTHINGEEVDSIEGVQALLKEAEDRPLAMAVLRSGQDIQITAVAVEAEDGAHKLGLWLRDSMAGIGTLTYYNPENGDFAALGHGINDVDTAQLMPLESGAILYADVADVKKGLVGQPGELQGAFDVSRELGSLSLNSDIGIYGTLEEESYHQGLVPLNTASFQDIQVGPATILANVTGDQVEEYTVNILELYPEYQGDSRNMMIEVTDPRLLQITGGIVQGMSGSPILQQNRIIGAVTHVLVNDPTRGYGIYIGNMLDAQEG